MKNMLWMMMQKSEMSYYLIYAVAYRFYSPEKTVGEMSQDIERLQKDGWVAPEVQNICLDYFAGKITVESIPKQKGKNAVIRIWREKRMVLGN